MAAAASEAAEGVTAGMVGFAETACSRDVSGCLNQRFTQGGKIYNAAHEPI